MADGCKHGHEANSCTACHEQRRIAQLTAERDALKADRDQWERTATERANALDARVELSQTAKLQLEVERLRALVAKLEERPVITELRELREAAADAADTLHLEGCHETARKLETLIGKKSDCWCYEGMPKP